MTQSKLDILGGLREIIEESAGTPASEIRPESLLTEELDIDSLCMVEVAVAAQERFNLELPDDELKDLKTVQDVVDLIARLGTPE